MTWMILRIVVGVRRNGILYLDDSAVRPIFPKRES
jgi:hypothetical protein